ncbi:MAG: hypothetical protein FJX60_23060 [Alphaproteobacteria bacterium]|nr:hypothetical protein [Alphaproteobacteria bacterium]
MRRNLILASIAVATLVAAAAPAESRSRVGTEVYIRVHGPYHYHGPAYYPHYPRYYFAPRPVYYTPRPVYYTPPPIVYTAPPVGVVIREGRDSSGNYCREYQSTASIDGRPVPTYGTACLRPDGSWQIVN